jgi:hypothetical protein
MSFAKKSVRARQPKKGRPRLKRPEASRVRVVETTREVKSEPEDEAKAAECFADWFLIDFGIRG